MRYTPCQACRFNPGECDRRQSIAAAVREFNRSIPDGSQLTSIRFTCPDRTIGFEPGSRVIVEDCSGEDIYGSECVKEIPGTVIDHRGLKVRIWLERETSRGKRLLSIYPRPLRVHGAIGVRTTGERVDLESVWPELVRETRRRDGKPGDDEWFCPDCETFHEHPESGVVLEPYRCPSCNGTAIAPSEDLVPEIEAFEVRRGKERTA